MTVQKAKTIDLKKPETRDKGWHILDISQFFDLKASLDGAATESAKSHHLGTNIDRIWPFLATFWDRHSAISMQSTYPPLSFQTVQKHRQDWAQ